MSLVTAASRPALRLVRPEDEAWIWFCGHCGSPHSESEALAKMPRVCPQCTFGVLLGARADGAPRPDQPFVVVDSSLAVQAVSGGAELALAMHERDAVNRHVTELLIPAEAEAPGLSLAEAVTIAVSADREPINVYVRPAGAFGIRLRARISACGPPRAALLVLD